MSIDQILKELQNLRRKISLIKSENKKLKEELSYTIEENKKLIEKIVNQENSISDFQDQIKIGTMANGMKTSEGNSVKLRKKIDDYIDKIDECITHLEN